MVPATCVTGLHFPKHPFPTQLPNDCSAAAADAPVNDDDAAPLLDILLSASHSQVHTHAVRHILTQTRRPDDRHKWSRSDERILLTSVTQRTVKSGL